MSYGAMACLRDLLSLIRPVNSILVGFAVIVGAAVASPERVASLPSILGFLTGFFISAYSMILNDRYDIEVDRVNKPDRPLPSGRVSPSTAIIYALLLLFIGLIISATTSLENLIIASIFACLAWLYNYWGKKQGFIGNMMVAASVAIPYLYGGIAVRVASNPLLAFLTLTSFLAASGREVVKTISDISGDKVRNVKSVARVHGPRMASILGAALFIAAIISTLFPILTKAAGLVFGIFVLIPDAVFAYASLRILKDHSATNALKVKKITLLGMLLGLIAFIVGGVFKE